VKAFLPRGRYLPACKNSATVLSWLNGGARHDFAALGAAIETPQKIARSLLA
jgi:hypothetical protein